VEEEPWSPLHNEGKKTGNGTRYFSQSRDEEGGKGDGLGSFLSERTLDVLWVRLAARPRRVVGGPPLPEGGDGIGFSI